MSEPLHIKDAEFKTKVLENELPVMVDFYADWCGPCKRLAPVIAEIAAEYEGKAVVYKMNVDDEPNTSAEFGISSIPTLFFFKNGKAVNSSVGMVSKEHIKDMLDAAIAA